MTDFHAPLSPEQLRKRCDVHDFSFGTTDELPDIDLAIGQERALEALEFGLGISQPGFNIFALGPAGLGKTSAVHAVIARLSASQPTPDDWCYVHDFAAPAKPRALRLPAGQGRQFVADIEAAIDELTEAIPVAFESEAYRARAEDIEEAAAIDALRQESQKLQIALIETPTGYAFAPVNEQAEGFFDVCRESGLTGNQGVIIPRANQANLMLRDDLVEEAAAGRFQVHAVSTVDDALALLLDTAAGERDDSGEFPAGSVNGRVEARLREWAMLAVQLNQGGNAE
jgi:predicted ATP-dependent protease